MPNADGTPSQGEPGYQAPNTGLLTVGQAAATSASPSSPPPQMPPPALASSAGYTPSKYVVTPEQTVEGRTAKIVGEDSVLMQQARTRANQDAQAKGLLSSSIAVGAGQNAVLDKAVPIAAQDAQAYNQAMTNTVNQENAASQFTAQAGNVASLTNAGNINESFRASLASATTLANSKLNNETSIALGNLDAQTKMAITTTDNQYKQLLQTNSAASNAYVQAVTNIANIANNNTMGKDAKDAATATQLNMLNEQLKTLSSVASTSPQNVTQLDLSQFFKDLPEAAGAPVVGPSGPAGASGTITYTGANGLQYATQEQADRSLGG